jgi:hypothetical protein
MPYDTYEPDFTFDDPASAEVAPYMYGGGPYRGGAIAAASTPPPSSPEEFLPQRDITPMGDPKFFRELDASGLNAAQRLRLQGEYFRGVDQVQAYRDRLRENEQKSMINDLRIAQAQETLAGIRRQQTAAQQANESRDEIARRVQEIRLTHADPAAQAQALAELETEYLPKVASDQTVSRMFDVARSGLPKPQVSSISPKDLGQMADKLERVFGPQDAQEILARGDEFEIHYATSRADHELSLQDARRRGDLTREAEISRDFTRRITDLASTNFRFMSQKERDEAGVWGADENRKVRPEGDTTPYLHPEAHAKARELLFLTATPSEVAAFEALSDEQKAAFMQEYRFEVLKKSLSSREEFVEALRSRESAESRRNAAQADRQVFGD